MIYDLLWPTENVAFSKKNAKYIKIWIASRNWESYVEEGRYAWQFLNKVRDWERHRV